MLFSSLILSRLTSSKCRSFVLETIDSVFTYGDTETTFDMVKPNTILYESFSLFSYCNYLNDVSNAVISNNFLACNDCYLVCKKNNNLH